MKYTTQQAVVTFAHPYDCREHIKPAKKTLAMTIIKIVVASLDFGL